MSTQIMIDIEALGTKPGCQVLSIGAVAFHPETKTLGKSFYGVLDVRAQEREGLTTNFETIRWWMGQNKEARDDVFKGQRLAVEPLLYGFNNWLRDVGGCDERTGELEAPIWANDPDYDISILEALYSAFRNDTCWGFRHESFRGFRKHVVGKSQPWPEVEGFIPHHALWDAKKQAAYIMEYWHLSKEAQDNA